MKNSIYILSTFVAGVIFLSSCAIQNYSYIDDIYYSPDIDGFNNETTNDKTENYISGQNSVDENYDIDYNTSQGEVPGYDEYEYAERLSRFGSSENRESYYTDDQYDYNINLHLGYIDYPYYYGPYFGFNYNWGWPYYNYYDPWFYNYRPYYSLYYGWYYPYHYYPYHYYNHHNDNISYKQMGYGKRRSVGSGIIETSPGTVQYRKNTSTINSETGVRQMNRTNSVSSSSDKSSTVTKSRYQQGNITGTNNQITSGTTQTSSVNNNPGVKTRQNTGNTNNPSIIGNSAATQTQISRQNTNTSRTGYSPSYSRPKPTSTPSYNQSNRAKNLNQTQNNNIRQNSSTRNSNRSINTQGNATNRNSNNSRSNYSAPRSSSSGNTYSAPSRSSSSSGTTNSGNSSGSSNSSSGSRRR